LAKRFASRNGGYTRITPAGYRRGDNAQMATISFTEEAPKAQKPAKPEAKKAKQPAKKPVKKEQADVKK